jgi:hypothetical protein
MATVKTFGAGGEYATWREAMAPLVSGGLSDDTTLLQVGDSTESVDGLAPNTDWLNTNGYNLTITQSVFQQYKIYLTGGSSLYFLILCLPPPSPEPDKLSTITSQNLHIIRQSGLANYGTDLCMGNSYYAAWRAGIIRRNNFVYKNIFLENKATGTQVAIQPGEQYSNQTFINIKITGYTNGFNAYPKTQGGGNPGDENNDGRRYENISSQNCQECFNVVGSTTLAGTYKNCVGLKRDNASAKCFVGGFTYNTFLNCADSDGSLPDHTGKITGITDADFLSVDPSSPNFLKIDTTSALFGTGTTDILAENTTDIEGNPRPNELGSVSIGAHEPVVTVDFSGTPLTGTAPLAVQFTDLTTYLPTSWLWDFGDGTTSTEQHPLHTYTEAGTYTVSLAVNGYGTETKTDYITVTPGKIFRTCIVRSIRTDYDGSLRQMISAIGGE